MNTQLNKKPIIEVRHLCKKYGSGEAATIALNDVSLEIYEGEFLCILGSSGSGKSTLLNLLGGIDKADDGLITCLEKPISTYSDNEVTRFRHDQIGFVFQSFNLINELTALENVMLVANNKPNAIDALMRVGLEAKINQYPSKMSGGQQQRVSIARAIVNKPPILLCDEPTGALDYETGREILVELEKICRNEKRTIVFVTHTREISKMADRTIRMRNGKIEEVEINQEPIKAIDVKW